MPAIQGEGCLLQTYSILLGQFCYAFHSKHQTKSIFLRYVWFEAISLPAVIGE